MSSNPPSYFAGPTHSTTEDTAITSQMDMDDNILDRIQLISILLGPH